MLCLSFRTIAFLSVIVISGAIVIAGPASGQATDGHSFFSPTPDSALRGFSPDRPTKGFSPITVDAGHIQYETDFYSYTHSNVGGVTTRLRTIADPVLKLGLSDHLDVALQFDGYNFQTVHDAGTGVRLQDLRGAGDLVVRFKLNLFGERGGPAFALLPYIKVPTAAHTIGNGHTEGGLIAPFVFPLPLGFTVLIMPELDVLKNAADSGHHFSFAPLLSVSHSIGSNVTVSAELYSAWGTDARTPPVYTADGAIAYSVTNTLQLDAGVNVGLNRNAPDFQVYTGIAQRF